MDKYKELLKYVTNDILGKIEEQDTLNIFSLGDLNGMLNNNTNQNEFEIVYAIISKKVEPLEKALPFFSMVNLMMSVQELDRMHMRYSVKIIQKEEKL